MPDGRLPEEVLDAIDRIRRDRVSGASQLTRASLETLKLASEKAAGENFEEFFGSLRAAVRLLVKAKPTMASIANVSAIFLWKVKEKTSKLKPFSLAEARRISLEEALSLIAEYDGRLRRTILNGSKLIGEGEKVATCSYSSILVEVFRVAKSRRVNFRVLVAASTHRGVSHGENLAKKLSEFGVPAKVYPDSSIGEMLEEASLVMLGTDTILADGSIVNGKPSLRLAIEAEKRFKPLYVICDSLKISVKPPRIEEGFDLVDRNLIRAIITEEGKLKPERLKRKVEELKRQTLLI